MKYSPGFHTAVALLGVSLLLSGIVSAGPAERTLRPLPAAASDSSTGSQTNGASSPDTTGGVVVGRLVTEKGFPVAWALVGLVPQDSLAPAAADSYSFVSGQDGTFMAGSIRPGLYRVVVSHVGFKPVKPFLIRISAQRRAFFDVVLEERLYESPSIIVIAERAPEQNHPLQQTIAAEELSEKTGALEDPLRALAAKPGIETRNDFDGRLSFRGSDPRETGYSLDGIPLPLTYHLGGLTSIFHPSSIEAIDFYPAGQPASLGSGTAGFVDVKSRRSDWDGQGRRIELSPIAMGGLWHDAGTSWTGFISARRTYHDWLLHSIHRDGGYTIPNFYDLQMRGDWKRSDDERLSFQLLRSGDRVDMGLAGLSGGGTGNNIRLSGDLLRAAGTWDRRWERPVASPLQTGFTIAYQPYEYDLRVDGDDHESMDWDAGAWIVSGRAALDPGNHRVEMGLINIQQQLDYAVFLGRGFWQDWSGSPTEGSLEGDPVTIAGAGRRDTSYRALFVQDRWRPRDGRWDITAGLRGERYQASNEQAVSPRAAFCYRFGATDVHGAWGRYTGHPADQPGDPTSIGEGILLRRATHSVAGIGRDLGSWGRLRADGYRRRTSGLVSEMSPGVYASVGEGLAYGVELEWQRKTKQWETGLAYSWGRSMKRDTNGPIQRYAEPLPGGGYRITWIHGDPGWYTSPFDPGHSLGLAARWKPSPNFKMDLAWSYRSGVPVTPITEVYEDGQGNAYGIEGTPGSRRLPAYHRLDVRAERFRDTSWGRYSVYLEITNLYNRANIFQSSYNGDYTGHVDHRMLPLLPALGVAFEF